jgi:glycerophosphoryl diester phosphodiesterase
VVIRIVHRWRDALKRLPFFGRLLILFQLAFALVAGALFSPALAWLLGQLIRSSGDYAISNYDLFSFFLSPKGLSFLVGSGATALALFYLELSGLLLITADPTRPIRALPALRLALLRFGKLLRLGLLQVLGLALLAAPFLAGIGAVKLTLLGVYDINYYLYTQPPEWTRALIIAGALGLGGVAALLLLSFRWLLALPILINSGVRPWMALRESWGLTRGHVLESAGTLGGWWLAVTLVGAALAGALNRSAELLLDWADPRPILVFLLAVVFLALLLALTLAGSFLTLGINAMLINRLFGDLTGGAGVLSPPELRGAEAPVVAWNPIRLAWIAVLTLFLAMSLVGVVRVASLEFEDAVAITAHRGSSRTAPENTLSALRQAMEDGADYAEIDVQTTGDGQVVIMHDRDFMRVAGDPRRLENLTLEEARRIDVGRWFAPGFAEEPVPTLSEAITLVRGRMRLNIELKYNRPDPGLAAAVIEILRREGFVDQCVITSLDLGSLRQVEEAEPDLATGLVLTRAVGNPARLPVDFLSVNTSAATNRLISYAQRTGKAIHVWTVNDPDTMTRMLDAGVDNVITDEPAEMRRVLEERKALNQAEKLILLLRRRLVG